MGLLGWRGRRLGRQAWSGPWQSPATVGAPRALPTGGAGRWHTVPGSESLCFPHPDAPHANGGLGRRESQGSVSSAGSLDLVSHARPGPEGLVDS